jgi:NADH dehydrogenase [ubiquinone] 1 alpha subcomplex assembly factor 7
MIRKKNILSLDKFIFKSLYDRKNGYYMKKNPFGKKGDYITSPNISILFSEMIAVWIVSFWQNLGCPKKFNLIELGAGNGEMMKDMIFTFEKFPSFKSSYKINILEKSNYLKQIQKKKLKNQNIRWIKSLKEISNVPTIFIANEFFDALPIKQFFKKKKLWYERKVQFFKKKKPSFIDILVNIKKVEKKIGLNISKDQNFIEFSPLLFEYIKKISNKIALNGGGILIIDYGYWDKRMSNTLKCFSNHKITNIFSQIGNNDITYNLSFELLKKIFNKFNLKINGKSNQKSFLINMGILKRAEIISKNLPFSKKADIYYRVQKLINKNSMGEIFKVMLATRDDCNFNSGFIK